MNNLPSTTPYMLRNEGTLLTCGSIHPYILMSVKASLETNIETLDSHLNFLDWFYENTLQESVRNYIDLYKETKNPDLLEQLNTLTNNEFCKVRTSNYKVPYGGDNGQIYFRVSSSNGFNWFDLIYNVVLQYDNLDYVTIIKDPQAFKDVKDFDYYKVNGVEINQLPIEEFLTLEGNPIVENIENTDNKEDAEISLIIDQLLTLERSLKSSTIRTKSKDNSAYNGSINQLSDEELIDKLIALGYKVKRSKNKNYSFLVEKMLKENSKVQTEVKSNGIYSVLNNRWIKEPVQSDIPDINREEFDNLFNEWEDKYFELLDNLKSENIQEKLIVKDPRDRRKKIIVPETIETVINSSEFKELYNICDKHSVKTGFAHGCDKGYNPKDNSFYFFWTWGSQNDGYFPDKKSISKFYKELGVKNYDVDQSNPEHNFKNLKINGCTVKIEITEGFRIYGISIYDDRLEEFE